MCLVYKNEYYLDEWVEYHKQLGCSKFYLFDNNSSFLTPESVLHYVDTGLVEIRTLGNEHGVMKQLKAFTTCITEFGHLHDFMGFIDSDEFIVIKDKTKLIPDILKAYTEYGGLTLNWMVFGSSGHIKKPPGGLLKNYYKCYPNFHIKTIVNLAYVSNTINPHYFHYKDNKYAVDIAGNKVKAALNPANGSNLSNYLFDTMYINHYYCKSFEEFKEMLLKRGSISNHKNINIFHDFDKKAIYNCSILEMPN
jgi:hypothetical protein